MTPTLEWPGRPVRTETLVRAASATTLSGASLAGALTSCTVRVTPSRPELSQMVIEVLPRQLPPLGAGQWTKQRMLGRH